MLSMGMLNQHAVHTKVKGLSGHSVQKLLSEHTHTHIRRINCFTWTTTGTVGVVVRTGMTRSVPVAFCNAIATNRCLLRWAVASIQRRTACRPTGWRNMVDPDQIYSEYYPPAVIAGRGSDRLVRRRRFDIVGVWCSLPTCFSDGITQLSTWNVCVQVCKLKRTSTTCLLSTGDQGICLFIKQR